MTNNESPHAGLPLTIGFQEFEPERVHLRTMLDRDPAPELQRMQDVLALPQHPLFLLPEGASATLAHAQAALQEKILLFFERTKQIGTVSFSLDKRQLIASIAHTLNEEVLAYERECDATAIGLLRELWDDPSNVPYYQELQSALGIAGGAEGMQIVMDHLLAPLPAPPANDPKLQEMYRALLRDHYALTDSVFNLSVLNMQMAAAHPQAEWERAFTDADRTNALKAIGTYILYRNNYEGLMKREKPKDSSKTLLYLGMVAEELAEEGMESFTFGQPLVRAPESLRGMDAALRARVLQGYEGASKFLHGKAPALSEVMRSVSRSPVGAEFWKRLFTIESPVTVMLYMIYVHKSGDKLKATMNFAAFMATSAASNAMLESGTLLLRQSAKIALGMNRGKEALWLTRLARLPKNPTIQLTAALLLAFGLSEQIDQLTSWISEKIPDGAWKRGAEDIINIGSGGSVIESGAFALTEVNLPGFQNVINPERDSFGYLSKELLTIKSRNGSRWPTLERERMNSVVDWNARVENAMRRSWNPVQRELFALERINGEEWADREAFHLFGQVQHARRLEEAITAQMRMRRGAAGHTLPMDFVDYATSDSLAERQDYAIRELEDNSATPQGMIRAYIDSLQDSKVRVDQELVELWKEYRSMTDTIAERVVTYRQLGMYSRAEWLGEEGGTHPQVTEKVQRGIAEEINKIVLRDAILLYDKEGDAAREEFTRDMSSITKYQTIDHDVSDSWLGSLIIPGGKVVDPRSGFYKTSLVAAAEAVGIAYPEHHDINRLFKELRESIAAKKVLSIEELTEMRDRFSDALLETFEKQQSYRRGSDDLCDAFRLSDDHTYALLSLDPRAVTEAREHGIPSNWPVRLLTHAFERKLTLERASRRADIVLFQEVLPDWSDRSRHKINCMAMTCIEASGSDPERWKVRVFRHSKMRSVPGVRTDIQNAGNEGTMTEMDFPLWCLQHPAAASAIASSVEELRLQRGAPLSPEQEQEQEKGRLYAEQSTDVFIALPHTGTYRRKANDGFLTLHTLPFRNGLLTKEAYQFDFQKEGKVISYTVRSHVFLDRKDRSDDEKKLILDTVTTPIEGRDRESLFGVLSLFDFKEQPWDGQSEIDERGGLLAGLLPLYTRAVHKKAFLQKLFSDLRKSGDAIHSDDERNRIVRWYVTHRNLFLTASPEQLSQFLEGDSLLGMPDENGVYTLKSSGKHSGIHTLHIAYSTENGWRWHPGMESRNPLPDTWYSVHEVNVPWKDDSGRERYVSPKEGNMALLQALQRIMSRKSEHA